MYYHVAKEVLTVRDVDEEVWRKFRAKTEEEGPKTGQALNEALDIWIKEKERKRVRPEGSGQVNLRKGRSLHGLMRRLYQGSG